MNNNYDIKKIFLVVFSIVFVAGFIIMLQSYEIGSFFATTPIGEGEFEVNSQMILFKTISFLILGGVISLFSGFGLVKTLLKYMD